jgi:hypothetical protein
MRPRTAIVLGPPVQELDVVEAEFDFDFIQRNSESRRL